MFIFKVQITDYKTTTGQNKINAGKLANYDYNRTTNKR